MKTVSINNNVEISRTWAMPHRYTFTIKPIKELLLSYNVGAGWYDPFAGYNSPAEFKNDLDPESNAQSHLDALDYLKTLPDTCADGVIYDPPYSFTQARKYGHKKYSNMNYWAGCKNEIARITKSGGVVISFGWNSNGMGMSRGFGINKCLLVAHGGSKNDTIVTVETKL